MERQNATAIGIDLGTTKSCVAVWRHGVVDIVVNEQGHRLTPSMVAFTETEYIVGDLAKLYAIDNPTNTVHGMKLIIGRNFNDKSVQEDIKTWPFNVVCENDRPKIEVMYKNERKSFSAEVISAMVLRKMKEVAEAHLWHEVTDAVITVPAYFDKSQRKATLDAGNIAGLNVLEILNEPTAAAIANGLGKMNGGRRNVIVFGLETSTFHVTIMTIKDGKCTTKAGAWDTHFGGKDIVKRLGDHFVKEFKRRHNKDISSNKRAMSLLNANCKCAKQQLSTVKRISIHLDSIYEGIDLNSNLTRNQFEELNKDLFTKTITAVKEALYDAKMEKSDIDDVLLVGASTRIPKIQSLLSEFFDGKNLTRYINPSEVVAYGAAIQAALIQGNTSEEIRNLRLTDIMPWPLRNAIGNGTAAADIQHNTIIPTNDVEVFTTSVYNQGEMSKIKYNNINDTRLDDGTLWRLSEYLDVPKWTQIGKQLGLKSIAIYNIEQKCRNKDNREHVDAMLLEWRQQYPEQCNLLELISALKNLKLNDIAKRIEQDFWSK